MPAPEQARIGKLFLALADSGRRSMIEQLGGGPASVSELARPLGISLPSAMKHLAALEAGGLVRSHKAGRARVFALAPGGFDALEAWLAERRHAWNRAFDRLEAHLRDTDDAGGDTT